MRICQNVVPNTLCMYSPPTKYQYYEEVFNHHFIFMQLCPLPRQFCRIWLIKETLNILNKNQPKNPSSIAM